MKKIVLIALLLFSAISAIAETKYCMMRIERDSKDILTRYTADVDYGEGFKSLYSDEKNENWHFTSMVEAINKLAKEGWTIVSINNESTIRGFIITFKKEEKQKEEQ